ncbi:hypothetical protein V4B17_03835 [Bartonella sp. B23]
MRNGKEKVEENLQKAQKFANLELTQCIEFRDYTLQRFDKLIQPETLEKEIHNLFILQRRLANKTSSLPLRENNLWLLDDEFTSYDYLQGKEGTNKFLSQVSLLSADSEDDIQKLSNHPDVVVYFDSTQEKNELF